MEILELLEKNQKKRELIIHSLKGEVESLSPHGRNWLGGIRRYVDEIEKLDEEQEELFKKYKEE